jgi:hypothetical protein
VDLNLSYETLPLGSVKATGWLLATLKRQAAGLTGLLDQIEPRPGFKANPVREDSVWRGGMVGRDFLEIASERAPYYLRGLVALAYSLDDQELKAKFGVWLDYWLANQNGEGNLEARGVSSFQWWPRMLIIDTMRFYYEATGDQRALSFIERFFNFQLKNLEKHPLTKNILYLPEWRSWASFRGADNMASAAWLYNLNGDAALLRLAAMINSQTYSWENYFATKESIHTHAVNLAHGLRKPAVQHMFWPDEQLEEQLRTGLQKTFSQHGHVGGAIAGDEQTSGRGPSAGSELCTVVELIRSLQAMLSTFGDPAHADRIEKAAYNALPAALAADFRSHQYFQQANQVYCTLGYHGFNANKADPPPPIGPWYRDALAFGAPAGYQCCIYNFHLAWPLFVSSMWMKRNNNALVAQLYGPCRVETVINGVQVTIEEKTSYPFSEEIRMQIQSDCPVQFELLLRIPEWCSEGRATVDDKTYRATGGTYLSLNQVWKSGDRVNLVLPMLPRFKSWQQGQLTLERGPLVFAYNPSEKWVSLENSADFPTFEVLPEAEEPNKCRDGSWSFGANPDWNYGINRNSTVRVSENHAEDYNVFPWTPATAPVKLHLSGTRLPQWQRTKSKSDGGLNAGPLQSGPLALENVDKEDPKELTLIPYGAARLRISIFPSL